jgi:two-component system alkaline phosphatase synthesis response regulator PhoP
MAGTVLVVEDEPQILQLLEFWLQSEGYDVVTASDGRAAIEKLEGDPPDIVILDVMLPHVSGVEVLEKIRSLPGWRDTPVLMLTAKRAEQDIVRAFDAGADDYVAKPFQLEELVARMQRLLRGRGRRDEG